MAEVVIFSQISGQILSNGVPLPNALITRTSEYKELITDQTTTDANGSFQFAEQTHKRLFTLFPAEFVVAQSITVKTNDAEYLIWSNSKRAPEANSELGGAKIDISCNLEDPLKIYKEFGSILRTNCRWGASKTTETTSHYLFSEHLTSTKWLKDLPSGVLSEKVDLNYNTVSIERQRDGLTIYVGPISPNQGGSAVTVWLDSNLELINYEIERLAPIPLPDKI